jgi:hypothetical protein
MSETIEKSCRNCDHSSVCLLSLSIYDLITQTPMFFHGEQHKKQVGQDVLDAVGRNCMYYSEVQNE